MFGNRNLHRITQYPCVVTFLKLGGSCVRIADSRRFVWISVPETTLVENLASRFVFLQSSGALVLFFVDCLLCNYSLGEALSVD